MTDDHDNVIRFPHCARRVDDLDAELAKLEALLGASGRYYKLDGHIPIRVETLKAWADEVAQHDCITALTGIDPWRVFSDSTPKAALFTLTGNWRALFDDLVGNEREERGRHSKTEPLCGPEIDGKLEMGRHLDRKIAGPRALEEAGERTGEGRDGAIDPARRHVR
jgi:hypothetical protein